MRYHILYVKPDLLNFHLWDVDENTVNQIVIAFLRELDEVIINGRRISLGTKLMIYENQMQDGVSGALIDSFLKAEGAKTNFSLDFFERKFKNVTDSFLRGRNRGDLKNDFYNIYINDGPNKPVIIVINEFEVQDLLNKWANGESPIWVSGRRIDLNNPKSIKIYNISIEWLSKDRGDIKLNIKKYAKLANKGSYSIDTLEHFGKDVTDKWDVKPFGKSYTKSSSFDWGIIHPVIFEVANSRFNSVHYADAVESAFKEINEIIKKEYRDKEGKEEDGTSLMRKAFAHQNPVFKLTDLSTESLKNIQHGYMDIFAGVMMGIRNPKAHANLKIDELDSWEKIVMASHLMKIWDSRIL